MNDPIESWWTFKADVAANDLDALIADFDKVRADREREQARRAQDLRKKPRRAPKRAGKGHDPRLQVNARVPVRRAGRGRR